MIWAIRRVELKRVDSPRNPRLTDSTKKKVASTAGYRNTSDFCKNGSAAKREGEGGEKGRSEGRAQRASS
jgi:hypothetical protein